MNDRPGAYPRSYYAATANDLRPFPNADGAISCDICVVGGGYTGLSAALHLAETGLDVVVMEAHRAGWGASGRNGGQVGTGQRREQDELESMLGRKGAMDLWRLGLEAVDLVKELVSKHDIRCGFKPGIIHADHKARFVPHSHRYVEKLQSDYDYTQIQALNAAQLGELVGSEAYYGGMLDMGGGHLHPLNFARGLAAAATSRGARVFENSPVLGFENGPKVRVRSTQATVDADHLILACNGYLDDLDRDIGARVMPINNFIIATEPLAPALRTELIRNDAAVADSRFVVNYFRMSEDGRMLFGGGETYGNRFPSDITGLVRPRMLEIYPQLRDARIEFEWGGTLAITMNRLPYFGRSAGNVFSASGYSGHGLALATLAGQILAEAVGGTLSRFDVFSAVKTRAFPGGRLARAPLLVLAMTYYALRDRL